MLLTHDVFDISKMMFLEPKEIEVAGKKTGPKSWRVPIRYDAVNQPLKVQMPTLFSWGVQEYRDGDSVSSYSMSLVMYNAKNGGSATAEERGTIEMFEAILEKIRKYLKMKSTKDAMKKYNMDTDVDKMDVFFRKRDEGVIVEGVAPVMYPKLYTRRVKDCNELKIETKFYDAKDEVLNPVELLSKRIIVVTSVVVDNVFIGAKPSIQLRVKECIVVDNVSETRELYLPKSVVEKSVFDDDDDDDYDELINKRRKLDDK